MCQEHEKQLEIKNRRHLSVKVIKNVVQTNFDVCVNHDATRLQFFCVDCNKGLCNQCFISMSGQMHQGHSIIDAKSE